MNTLKDTGLVLTEDDIKEMAYQARADYDAKFHPTADIEDGLAVGLYADNVKGHEFEIDCYFKSERKDDSFGHAFGTEKIIYFDWYLHSASIAETYLDGDLVKNPDFNEQLFINNFN